MQKLKDKVMNFFHLQHLCYNYGHNHYTIEKEIVNFVLDRIHKFANNCTSFQGFLVFNASGGGTESGLGSLLLEMLKVDYKRKSKLSIASSLLPQVSTAAVEHCQSDHLAHALLEHINCILCLNNKVVYTIYSRNLNF